MTTQKLINDQGFEPGFRVNATYRYSPRFSFEGQFLWVSPWSEEQKREGSEALRREERKKGEPLTEGDSLYFGFKDPSYDGDYIYATVAKARYLSEFWTAEANAWDHWTPRQVDYFSLSGLAGVRYFHFNEGLNITYFKPGVHSDYNIHTKSSAFGVQVGLDFQVNPTRSLTWELLSKFGFMMDLVEQRQFLRDQDNTLTIRHLKRSKWQNGCFSDTMAWIGLQCKEHVNLHAGYQLIYLSSVGTAEDQISKRLSPQAGKNVQPNGVVLIHGLFVGLNISF
ncbi:MAG: hypothetical protein JSR58_08280 [Verrucomicrobia bacterium]|nr:hypothetical protein [Verrucomicrobiota bacterium]